MLSTHRYLHSGLTASLKATVLAGQLILDIDVVPGFNISALCGYLGPNAADKKLLESVWRAWRSFRSERHHTLAPAAKTGWARPNSHFWVVFAGGSGPACK